MQALVLYSMKKHNKQGATNMQKANVCIIFANTLIPNDP